MRGFLTLAHLPHPKAVAQEHSPLALIQQPLRFGQPFGRQPMTLPTRRRLEH
jgi:hypothetical protein